ncbi:alpha/beta fold hydrolase [Pseudomonas viciae]|uniref:alpha/beta fold hydrolase n=1 Tax=Pseudomonas viciae TaxID=2505979 RepID=UPI003B82F1A8
MLYPLSHSQWSIDHDQLATGSRIRLQRAPHPLRHPRRRPAAGVCPRHALLFLRMAPKGLYPGVRCPTQILWGEDDQWIPIERGRALHKLIPGAQFHPVPNAGHLVQEVAPEAIVAAVLRFLT